MAGSVCETNGPAVVEKCRKPTYLNRLTEDGKDHESQQAEKAGVGLHACVSRIVASEGLTWEE